MSTHDKTLGTDQTTQNWYEKRKETKSRGRNRGIKGDKENEMNEFDLCLFVGFNEKWINY